MLLRKVQVINMNNGMYGLSGDNSIAIDNSGWISTIGNWSFYSADSPTFVIKVDADMTNIISVGMRIKLTQTTIKYFIVTAISSFNDGFTLITVYGGTDYALANAIILSPYYSMVKSPFGFPMSPSKWTVEATNNADVSQATPTAQTWYNYLSITIPIGCWDLSWIGYGEFGRVNQSSIQGYTTLSTANNSESEQRFTAIIESFASSVTDFRAAHRVLVSYNVLLASKTVYYLNQKMTATGTGSWMDMRGDLSLTVIRATCTYL